MTQSSLALPGSEAEIVRLPIQAARVAVDALVPGGRVVGMTKGQFSLIDLIKALLEKTGPAHLTISTWTAGIRDVENVGFLTERGDALSLRLLVDRSFPGRQPKYCAKVLEVFGPEAIRCTRTHAKFVLLDNDAWSVVVRSSMNLNRNPRFEQFDIDDDPAIFRLFEGLIEEMETSAPEGLDGDPSQVEAAFVSALGGGVAERCDPRDELRSLSPF